MINDNLLRSKEAEFDTLAASTLEQLVRDDTLVNAEGLATYRKKLQVRWASQQYVGTSSACRKYTAAVQCATLCTSCYRPYDSACHMPNISTMCSTQCRACTFLS